MIFAFKFVEQRKYRDNVVFDEQKLDILENQVERCEGKGGKCWGRIEKKGIAYLAISSPTALIQALVLEARNRGSTATETRNQYSVCVSLACRNPCNAILQHAEKNGRGTPVLRRICDPIRIIAGNEIGNRAPPIFCGLPPLTETLSLLFLLYRVTRCITLILTRPFLRIPQ